MDVEGTQTNFATSTGATTTVYDIFEIAIITIDNEYVSGAFKGIVYSGTSGMEELYLKSAMENLSRQWNKTNKNPRK